MRTLVALTAVLALTVSVQAQERARGQSQPSQYETFNCSALKGQPQVCLLNPTDSQITDIDCETRGLFGGKGSKAVDLPRGGIPAHSITVVNMHSCHTALILTVLGGGERRIDNVNTDQQTQLIVPRQ